MIGYTINLPNRIGKEAFDKLNEEQQYWRKTQDKPKRWTRAELEEIKKKYNELTKEL